MRSRREVVARARDPRPSADRKFCPQNEVRFRLPGRDWTIGGYFLGSASDTTASRVCLGFPLKSLDRIDGEGRSHGEFSPRFCLASCGFHVRAARFSSTGSARRIFLLFAGGKNNIPIPRNLAGELRRCAIGVIFNRWMETSLGFGSLTAERGVSNLLDAFPFQISNHVAVAISRSKKKKSRDPAKGPRVADNMTNACSARLLAGRARSTVCFRVAWGPRRSVKGRVEHALGEITTRDARRGLFAAASTLPSRVADGPTLDSSPRIAPRRGVGREERVGVGGGAQRVEFYFIFQTREAGCVARGPNRARCASR